MKNGIFRLLMGLIFLSFTSCFNATLNISNGNNGPNNSFQTFTTSGSFNIPTGITQINLTVIGGGGGAEEALAVVLLERRVQTEMDLELQS